MIIDRRENARLYRGLHPLLDTALQWLEKQPAGSFMEGRTAIAGDDLYVIATHGHGKREAEARLEAHRNFIDLHLLLEGEESIGWRPTGECRRLAAPYDAEKDCVLFDDPPRVWLSLSPGSFAMFYPGDAHAPLVSGGMVRKLVFKIAVSPGTGA